jgi:hypothetical protein
VELDAVFVILTDSDSSTEILRGYDAGSTEAYPNRELPKSAQAKPHIHDKRAGQASENRHC